MLQEPLHAVQIYEELLKQLSSEQLLSFQDATRTFAISTNSKRTPKIFRSKHCSLFRMLQEPLFEGGEEEDEERRRQSRRK